VAAVASLLVEARFQFAHIRIIVAVAARNCKGVLCPLRVLGKQRVDSVYEDCRCASQKDDRLRSFGEPESSISRVAPMVAIVQIDP
jgi:hypothetical protein